MTFRCSVHVDFGDDVADDQASEIATIERGNDLAPETLGLTLAEGHAVLRALQVRLVAAQVEPWQATRRPCPACLAIGDRPMAVSGIPRSDAALRWSPAKIPNPPAYCGNVSEIPNSGEK